MEDFQFKMKNVVSTSVCKNTLDEAPQAYKDCKMIETAINIIDRVKPLLNLKNGGDSETWKERKAKIKARDLERKVMRGNK